MTVIGQPEQKSLINQFKGWALPIGEEMSDNCIYRSSLLLPELEGKRCLTVPMPNGNKHTRIGSETRFFMGFL